MSVINRPLRLVDTKKIAENLASRLVRGDVVTLAGDLGAGKHVFLNFSFTRSRMPGLK